MGRRSDGRTVGRSDGLIIGALAAGIVLVVSVSQTVRPSDIHSEYVKFLSRRDTIPPYLPHPHRRDPAPAGSLVPTRFGGWRFSPPAPRKLAHGGPWSL